MLLLSVVLNAQLVAVETVSRAFSVLRVKQMGQITASEQILL
jgi:hypothetical protein